MIESLKSKLEGNHYEAMLVKIDTCWWGDRKSKPSIDLKAFTEILETKEVASIKAETADTESTPGRRFSGFEKCVICQKMIKSSRNADVFWIEECNHYYHITCISQYINDKITAT